MNGISLIAFDFIILIVTATILAIIAKKTKQPPLIAYILTGLILGPVLLNIVSETEVIKLFSKLGIGFLLFLLGIEMNIKEIKGLLKPIASIALWQTVLQTSLAFIIPLALGFTLVETIVIALCTVFGATPVVVKLLADKDEINSLPGKIDVGVLILQDIYLVMILALFSAESLTNISAIGAAMGKFLVLVAVIGAISYLSTQYFLPKVFKKIAENKHTFFVYGVAWAFLFIGMSTYLGLSIEIGAFLAGLGLGQMPYRNELKDRVRPLTNFFIVIFFSSIGLTLGISNITAYWLEAVIASIILVIGNFWIMFFLIKRQGFDKETTFLGSINMTQVSEFSLIVATMAVGVQTGVLGQIGHDILGYVSVMAIITIPVSAYLINYNHQIYEKVEHLFKPFKNVKRHGESLKRLENHAIIVGYNDTAQRILPAINYYFKQVAIVDRNTKNVDLLEKEPVEYIFGDFKHVEMRNAAALTQADLIISFADEKIVDEKILEHCKEEAIVFQVARDPTTAAELYGLGADYVIQEDALANEKMKEYLKTYLENKEQFKKEIKTDEESIMWGGRCD